MPKQRIQKILAAAGFGSRRACEQLVEDGRVEVDGKVVMDLPIVVDPAVNKIKVDEKPIRVQKFVYFVLNKPKGYFCTNSDPDGRRRAIDLMVGVRERVFPVGRLDAETMGLLIMTNDGDLAMKLTHPKFQTPKTYRAEVRGQPTIEALDKLRKGVWLADGRTGPAEISVIHSSRKNSVLEITLREGRNREIRRMLARFGHPVNRLTRIKMGRISTKKLPLGSYRTLSEEEVKYLYRMADGLEKGDDAPIRAGSRERVTKTGRRRTGTTRLGGRSSNIRGRRSADKKKKIKRNARAGGSNTTTTKPHKLEAELVAKKANKKVVQESNKKVTKKTTRKQLPKPAQKSAEKPAKKAPQKGRAGKGADRETTFIPSGGRKKRRIISTD